MVTEPTDTSPLLFLVGNNGRERRRNVNKKKRMNIINRCLVHCPVIHSHFLFPSQSSPGIRPSTFLNAFPNCPVPAANLPSTAFGFGDQQFCDLRQHYEYSTSLHTVCASLYKPWASFSETRIQQYDPKDPLRRAYFALINHIIWGKDCLFRAKLSLS